MNIGNVIITIVIIMALLGVIYYLATRSIGPTNLQTSKPLVYKDLIKITDPVGDQGVVNPIIVRGEARGNWYFEASFPITVTNENGSILAESFAQAQGEWMTTEYVPFEGKIIITSDKVPATGSNIIIIFRKDNPSGLPENNDSISLKVKYGS